MTYQEELADIFENDKPEYSYAHCISADFGMGLGIAVAFNRKFDCKNKLVRKYGSLAKPYSQGDATYCARTDRVYNLITKTHYWDKPTLDSLRIALAYLKDECIQNNVKTLVIPPLGCGLDKLKYPDVKKLIHKTFEDMDIHIICRTNDKRFASINFFA